MHWVIQQGIFKPGNYQLLLSALDAFGVSYTSIAIPNGTFDMHPEVATDGNVYVCGAIKLAKIARDRGWVPGSFLNENLKVIEFNNINSSGFYASNVAKYVEAIQAQYG